MRWMSIEVKREEEEEEEEGWESISSGAKLMGVAARKHMMDESVWVCEDMCERVE